MDETGVDGEVAVVEKHRARDAVGQEIESQFVLGLRALITCGEKCEAHAPGGLVAHQGNVAARKLLRLGYVPQQWDQPLDLTIQQTIDAVEIPGHLSETERRLPYVRYIV